MNAAASWWENNLWLFIIGGFFVFAIGFFYWLEQQKPLPSGSHIVSTELLKERRPFDILYGHDNAPVTIIEYASLTCGHCKDFHDDVVVPLQSEFDSGRVRLLFRHYPLNKPALDAALLLSCIPQNQAIEVLDNLFLHQETWAVVEEPLLYLRQYFLKAGMDEASIKNCLSDEERKQALIDEQSRASEELDIRSTPTVFINETLYTGPYRIEALRKRISAVLKKR